MCNNIEYPTPGAKKIKAGPEKLSFASSVIFHAGNPEMCCQAAFSKVPAFPYNIYGLNFYF